ncbi:hypothetical protein [Flavobacterium cerinum]|uniref:Uncharacterized protein n=1 Tax=Flavobacterium cerinum TaxID=2502784 RepID=A0A444GLI3_9FLAO|nr:hypothetical protein [Flavobacterium cerinum]RWW91876.1 hypothetical protein EPI11_17695 [Flavobacterium cerinum]
MIDFSTRNKTESIFKHLQITTSTTVQAYDPLQEYRVNCVFAKGIKNDFSCSEIYVNVMAEKWRAWHFKTWEKRTKEIPYVSYIQHFKEQGIIRVGFRDK